MQEYHRQPHGILKNQTKLVFKFILYDVCVKNVSLESGRMMTNRVYLNLHQNGIHMEGVCIECNIECVPSRDEQLLGYPNPTLCTFSL